MADQGFGGTVVGGIQDISALLPLLGTEQCEEHVGSALEKGFLYSSVSPLSIFGSLGIVRAGFNILVASITIRKFKFLGAKELNNGGFNLKGEVAPMIGFDRKHPGRFLAESQLETMLAEEHIPNSESLTVSWQAGLFWWNVKLIMFSVALGAFGLLPYIALIRESDHPSGIPLIPTGWGFPIMRMLGSAACVIVLQLLIQMRILVILKTRLLFMTIDRFSLDMDTPVSSCLSAFKEKNKHLWNADLPSETCIWELERWLFASGPREGNPDVQSAEESGLNVARQFYASEFSRHFGSKSKGFIASFKHAALSFLLIVGVLSTIGGYIGCFYLIQHTSENSSGPLLWLGLEATLSVFRVLVWALNPSWDDSNGVVFKLELAPHPPLITCTESRTQINAQDGFNIVPVTRPDDFLTEVVAFTGPLKLVKWDNVKLYYVLAADDIALSTVNTADAIHGNLYIVVSNYEEQTSRLLRKDRDGDFQLYICTLVFGRDDTTIHVEVDFEDDVTEQKAHSFTANERAMQELASHYDEIISLLTNQSMKRDTFGKTWSMRHPPVKEQRSNGLITSGRYFEQLVLSVWRDIVAPFSKLKKRDVPKEFADVENGQSVDVVAQMEQDAQANEPTQREATHGASLPTEDTGQRQNFEGNQEDTYAHPEDESDENDESPLLSKRKMRKKGLYSLSKEDKAYLEQARLENRWITFPYRLEEWVEQYTGQYSNELQGSLSTSIPGDKYGSWTHEIEAMQRELLAAYCLCFLEHFLEYTSKKLYDFVEDSHLRMTKQVLTGAFDDNGERHVQEIRRKRKLKDRLETERVQLRKTHEEKKAERRDKRWSNQSAFPLTSEGDRPTTRLRSLVEAAKTDLLYISLRLKTELEQSNFTTWHNVRTYIQDHLNECSQALRPRNLVSSRRQDTGKVAEINMHYLLQSGEILIDRLISRLQNQQKEFLSVLEHMAEILDEVLSLGQSVPNEQKYWTSGALEERLRLMHQGEKYLPLFGEGVEAIGGVKNVARALTRSQPFAFVDFTSDCYEACKDWTAQQIISIVQDVKSVTGVFYLDKQFLESERNDIEAAVNNNIQAAIAGKQDVCSYSGMEIGWPSISHAMPRYLVSDRFNKSSSLTVTFWTLDQRDHVITLRHRSSAESEGVIVHLTLNSRSLDCALEASDTFVYQKIPLPADYLSAVGSRNEFKIAFLREAAQDGYHDYCISDILLPVRLAEPQRLKSVARKAQLASRFINAITPVKKM